MVGSQAEGAQVWTKSGRDIVTSVDIAVEEFLGRRLNALDGCPVVGEESGHAPPDDSPVYWLVDPICGTRNLAAGIPLVAINLARIVDGQPAMSLVGDVVTGEVFVARSGRGAWSAAENVPHRLAVSGASGILVIEDGPAIGSRRRAASKFLAAAVVADRWDVRAFGSTISLAYLAAGRIGGYALFSSSAVHATAGGLLAVEAGGMVTTIEGSPWGLSADSILAAATRELHAELLELIKR